MSVPEWTLKMSDGEYLTLRANTAALEGEVLTFYRSGEMVGAVYVSELVYAARDPDRPVEKSA